MATFPSFEYYIKIVPTVITKLSGERIKTYQYTAGSNMVQSRHPAISFRMDQSPITIEFVEKKQSLSHLTVQLFAIIGGVVTSLGLVGEIADRSLKRLIHKERIGKLG
jgi:hypothetical protein